MVRESRESRLSAHLDDNEDLKIYSNQAFVG